MTTQKALLIGILIGQALMLPYTIWLKLTPRIEAMTISDIYFNHNETIHLQIQDIPKGKTLYINIASEGEVNRQMQERFDDYTPVDGWYDPQTNTIWSVYDPLVLEHEIRHVTEGDFH